MPPEPRHTLAQDQLSRILASKTFAKAPRLREFLAFVVSEFLEGRAVKETVIGIHVFGKAAGYNPTSDAVVRTTANRVRRKLGDYYQSEGLLDLCVIELPLDAYAPKITLRKVAPACESEPTVKPTHALPIETVTPPSDVRIGSPGPVRRHFGLRHEEFLRLAPLAAVVMVVISAFGVLFARHLRNRPQPLPVARTIRMTNDGRPKIGPILRRGQRLWFQEEIDGRWRVASVAITGGDVIPSDLAMKDAMLLDIASDGSELLLSAVDGGQRQLWSWPFAGAARRLPSLMGETAGWAPDRSAIAFGTTNALHIVRGSAPATSTAFSPNLRVDVPKWSPDGRWMTFALFDLRGGIGKLWISDRFGRNPKPIVSGESAGPDQKGGSWTRDGSYFLFAAGSLKNHNLWAVHVSDRLWGLQFGKAVRLTEESDDWSWPIAGQAPGEVYAMKDLVRAALVRLTSPGDEWRPFLGGMSAYELDISKDGRWVAYTRYPDHTIFKSRPDGSSAERITPPQWESHQPHWSGDGSRIAFMGLKPAGKWRVYVFTTETGRIDEPMPEGDNQGVPVWWNDDRSLLFGDRLYGPNRTPMRLHLLDLPTRSAAELPASEGLWTVRSSPDGRYLSALRQDISALMVRGREDPEWRTLLQSGRLDDPAWSLDSKYIYLTAHDRHDLLRVRVRDGYTEPIADLRDFPLPDEAWFGSGPGGSALGLQAYRVREIYSLQWVLP